jgi:hypothetical protein
MTQFMTSWLDSDGTAGDENCAPRGGVARSPPPPPPPQDFNAHRRALVALPAAAVRRRSPGTNLQPLRSPSIAAGPSTDSYEPRRLPRTSLPLKGAPPATSQHR